MMKFSRVTLAEFMVCVRAIYAFGSGYKLGENYRLGAIEESRAKKADPEAWQLGYDLATKRHVYARNGP
jgi:hypothetical protein